MADAGNLISDIVRAADNVRCERGSGELRQRDNSKTPSNPEANMKKERSALSSQPSRSSGERQKVTRGRCARKKREIETREGDAALEWLELRQKWRFSLLRFSLLFPSK